MDEETRELGKPERSKRCAGEAVRATMVLPTPAAGKVLTYLGHLTNHTMERTLDVAKNSWLVGWLVAWLAGWLARNIQYPISTASTLNFPG